MNPAQDDEILRSPMTMWEERVGRRPPTAPRLERIETCWYVTSPGGKTVSCGIYRTDAPGLEVRAGYAEDDLLHSQVVSRIEVARELAATWRQAALDKGFIEITIA